ncbi:uncharacterized protein TNCV_3897071 [Trichonephila clavipes]|nr:uncharacterized protein TNCV_3897071 [Trichonephila clavipes]
MVAFHVENVCGGWPKSSIGKVVSMVICEMLRTHSVKILEIGLKRIVILRYESTLSWSNGFVKKPGEKTIDELCADGALRSWGSRIDSYGPTSDSHNLLVRTKVLPRQLASWDESERFCHIERVTSDRANKKRVPSELVDYFLDSWDGFKETKSLAEKSDYLEAIRRVHKKTGPTKTWERRTFDKQPLESKNKSVHFSGKGKNVRPLNRDPHKHEVSHGSSQIKREGPRAGESQFEKRKPIICCYCNETGHIKPVCPRLRKNNFETVANLTLNTGNDDPFKKFKMNMEINGIDRVCLRDSRSSIGVCSRSWISENDLLCEYVWLKSPLDEICHCVPLAKIKIKTKKGEFYTKAAIKQDSCDNDLYLLGNRTAELIESSGQGVQMINAVVTRRNRTAEVSEPVSKCRPLTNPVVNKSVENATSCDFENDNCDPPVRWTNVFPPSEVRGRGTEKNDRLKVEEGKEINEYKSSDCEVKVKTGEFEGSVRAVAMGGQQVINPDDIGNGSLELIGDKGVANPEGLICENICDEKYTIGTLMSCEKQLTVDRESFRNHAMAKIAEQLNREKENMCKTDMRKG